MFYLTGEKYLILRFYPSLDMKGVPLNSSQVLMLLLRRYQKEMSSAPASAITGEIHPKDSLCLQSIFRFFFI